MNRGRIVAGALAPHPPHLVYAENPPQNEPRAECGWEELRWAYERLRLSLATKPFDVILVHTPHWRTSRGHHVLASPHFKGLSVDPVFPHLFRYTYDLRVDVELAHAIVEETRAAGLEAVPMCNPDFRIDYGTLVSCHMTRPQWDIPIVAISSNTAHDDLSVEVGDARMKALGDATRRAVEATGRKALLLASCSLSHRHFTQEPALPEDMTHEHIYNYNQYLWDMRMLSLFRQGRTRQIVDEAPDFVEQAVSETRAGSLTWMLAAAGFPDEPCTVHGYGSVIGTGNAVVEVPPARVHSGDACDGKL
ncbi:MAG: tRNA U-34 5-methylaminomethyl-2-thiouridine biosynthesis protein [Silvanigrellales bacterium]|nr:tRNA U-34 5-methylaminomethyl-2-thiouridine biosynthesis protein [Silvanigrellales bacterium]